MQKIKIGNTANLLFGFQPAWDPTGSVTSPFFEPATSPLADQNTTSTPNSNTYWTGTPLITLHDNPESLLSAIFEYEVLPLNLSEKIDVPSGPLALGDADGDQARTAIQRPERKM